MRSGPIKKIQKPGDSVYKSKLVARVVSIVMRAGKKSTAEDIVYGVITKLDADKKQALAIKINPARMHKTTLLIS